MGDPREEWLIELELALKALLRREGVPELDIQWLLVRCEDSRRFSGEMRHASLDQLVKDVKGFGIEFAGLLPSELVSGPRLSR
jgi:hypothetical protein